MKKSTIWILGVIGFLLICLCCLFFKIPSIETDLLSRSEIALNNSGLKVDSLSLSGRDVSLYGVVPTEQAKIDAEKIIEKIWGVHTVYNNLQIISKPEEEIPEMKTKQIQKTLDQIFQVENIEFETSSSIIKPFSYTVLEKASSFLKENPEIKISINGHTDSKGNPDKNLRLSKLRAESVKEYFVKNGILENRLYANGFGSTQPIADNNTLEGRQKNRRVEFKIIKEN